MNIKALNKVLVLYQSLCTLYKHARGSKNHKPFRNIYIKFPVMLYEIYM